MRLKDYIVDRLMDLKNYHDSEATALRAEIGHVRAAVAATQAELQRQVTELHEESSMFLTAADYEKRHEILINRISGLERWQANMTGRAIGLGLIGAVFVAVVAAVVTHLLQ